MVIRPSITLLCGGQINKPLAIPIDHLDEFEREIYLRDFLPPNPSIQKKKLGLQTAVAVVGSSSSAAEAAGSEDVGGGTRNKKKDEWDTYKVVEL